MMKEHRIHLENLAINVIRVIGAGIFLALTFYAFRYTHFMIPREIERTATLKDSIWKNLLAIIIVGVVLICLRVLENKLSERKKKVLSVVAIILCMIWMGTAG
jgi:TRAP-type C4-dicarboxylate transport system permease small subunit